MRGIDAHSWTILVIGGAFLGATFPGMFVEFGMAYFRVTRLRGFATHVWSMLMCTVGFLLIMRELAVLLGIISVHH